MVVVSDTSPITNLIQIDALHLLRALFGRVIIPHAVFQELKQVPGHDEVLSQAEWIEHIPATPGPLLSELLAELDEGEAEAIALAIQFHADILLIDESTGRSVAERHGLRLTGLLGVLLRAKKAGHILLVRPYMDKLLSEVGFRISPQLFHDVLALAGEAG